MDLPRYYFPVRVCPHLGEEGDKKMAFADYGSCSNINIPEDVDDGVLKGIPQKAHGRLEGLDKILPMLPLSGSLTVKDPDKSRDFILGFDNYMNLYKSVDELLTLMISAKIQTARWNVSRNEEFANWKATLHTLQEKIKDHNFSTCHQLCNDPSIKESIEGLKKSLPCWMKTINDHYSYLQMGHNANCFKGFNRDFYKGLLCSINDELSSPILFHAGGLDFRDIHMTSISTDDNNLQNIEKTTTVSLEEPVYQVSLSKKGVLCVRHKDKCTVLTHNTSEHSLTIANSEPSHQGPLSDVCPSSFLANEILLSENSGTVTLWDVNTNKCRHLAKVQRFECHDRWTSSYFAGHPRQIVIADSTSVEMFDHRDSFQKGTDLFTLSPLLVKNELVVSAMPMDFPYHIICTDSTVFMMDQRFPCSPVFQWHLERTSHPQMLHFTKFLMNYNQFKSEAIVFVGTQQPAEILCLQVSHNDDSPPTSKVLPWLAGNPRAIFKEESQSMGIDWCDLYKRFQMSMTGMTVINKHNPRQKDFSVYQMDCFGDLFYQRFAFADRMDSDCMLLNNNDNEQFCLKEPPRRVHKAGRERVRKCLSKFTSLETPLESDTGPPKEDSSIQLRFSDVSEIFKTTTKCNSETKEPEKFPFSFNSSLEPWQSLPSEEVNTQLLIALKEGKDIAELLEERENDHEEKKVEMRAQVLRRRYRSKSKGKSVKQGRKE